MNDEKPLDTAAEQVDAWAYVELFGHTKIAGRVSERKCGTEIMFQVDVPNPDTGVHYTRLFNPKAIFSINPTTEEWCRRWAKTAQEYDHKPVPYLPKDTESKLLDEPDIDDD